MPDDQTAWHARGHNRNSLGIAFLLPGENDYATFIQALTTERVSKAQYASGVALVKQWMHDHGDLMLIRHSDLDPDRKVDPGVGFFWEYFINEIKK